MTDKFTTLTLADYVIEQRKHLNTFLDKIDNLIDWQPIEDILKKHYKRTRSADGRPAYPPLPMFKLLLLQRWYNLSDPKLEEALNDRISFIRFSGFSLTSPLPDHSTICRFRNTLLNLNIYDLLFNEIIRQLESKGILIKKGAIVDATIIESCRRPKKAIDTIPTDRKEEETTYKPDNITYSDDTDATWIKKGKRSYYGYKGHISVDSKHGFILGGHITPAHRSDTKELERLIDESHLPDGSKVIGDKGYASSENRTMLKNKRFKDLIMYKAKRNRPITNLEKKINRLISSVRYKVEQAIGILKRIYHFYRMRYKGIHKGNMEFLLNGMAYNLKKAALMME